MQSAHDDFFQEIGAHISEMNKKLDKNKVNEVTKFIERQET